MMTNRAHMHTQRHPESRMLSGSKGLPDYGSALCEEMLRFQPGQAQHDAVKLCVTVFSDIATIWQPVITRFIRVI